MDTPLLVGLVTMVAIFGAIEVAFALGAGYRRLESADVPIVRNGLLSLVGLLLAFSFSLADTRYEVRRQLLVDEANAIGSAHVHAGLCSEATRIKLRETLARYLDVRLEQAALDVDTEQFQRVDEQRVRLTRAIWSLMEEEFARDPHALTTATVVQALGHAFGLASSRRSVHRNHMPQSIVVLLIVGAIAGGLAIGYQPGSPTHDRRFGAVYCVLVGLLLFAILDLDTPGHGWVRVPVEPFVELRASLVAASQQGP